MYLPDTLPINIPLPDAIRHQLLPLSARRWYELVKTPGFPAFSVGRKIVVSRPGLEAWIAEQIKSKGYLSC